MSNEATKNTEPMDEELKGTAPETPEADTAPETAAQEPTAEEKLQTQLSELNDRLPAHPGGV